MAKILIVYHSQTGNTEKLAQAVKQGAEAEGLEVILKKAGDADLNDLLGCDGYCFGTPDYFSYMAGALKDFFDRTYYPAKGKLTGRPFVCFVSHGGGGAAVSSLTKMAEKFGLKSCAAPLSAEGKPDKSDLQKAEDLGGKLAQTVSKA